MLLKLQAAGEGGFEGLIASLLQEALNQRLLHAASGLQDGLDVASPRASTFQAAIECKRYGLSTPLSARDLVTQVEIAWQANPELDVWILATSREVTTQQDGALSRICSDLGIAYLSLATELAPKVGRLDALCVGYETAALTWLRSFGANELIDGFSAAFAEIKSRGGYERARAALLSDLHAPELGFRQFANQLNGGLLQDVLDRTKCKQRFRCALSAETLVEAGNSIRRIGVLERLTASWSAAQASDQASVALVLGDEGTGKSWVVTDWLRTLMQETNPPAVFFVPAKEPESNEALRVLADHTKRFGLPQTSDGAIVRRLRRWLMPGSAVQAGKRIIVVLDGINERQDRDLWADLIEAFGADMFSRVHLIVTCRKRTWAERFKRGIDRKIPVIEIGDFSDAEFDEAVVDLPAEHQRVIRSVGPLVRRPRYFHLARERSVLLREGEELTIETLYYFDWQHRESLRRDLSMDGLDFAEAIRGLAKVQHADRSLGLQELEAALGTEKFAARQEELASTNIIERTADGWRLRHEYFALGLGMYLADRMEERGGDVDSRVAEADEILGDTSAFDQTTSVLQHALTHALVSDRGFSVHTRVALLSVWAASLNSADELTVSLPRLQIPLELLFAFAEYHWGQDTTAHRMEQAILAALVRNMRVPALQAECVERLVRWAGFVHAHGEREDGPNAGKPSECREVLRLCGTSSHRFAASGIELNLQSKQLLVRLGRLAIAAVSASQVSVYWPVIEAALVSDQAMGEVRTESLAWLIRWAHEPIDALIDRTVTTLIADQDPVCFRAAYRLVTFATTEKLQGRLKDIPREQWPVGKRAELLESPYRDVFVAPTAAELPGYLRREDIPMHLKISRARGYAADRTVTFPESFVQAVGLVMDDIDVSQLRVHMGNGTADHVLEQILPLACRLAPDRVVGLARRFAASCVARKGTALRQASFTAQEFSSLLDDEAVAAIWSTWERVAQADEQDLPDAHFVECQFTETLMEHLSAVEQLEFLRRRGGEAGQPTGMVGYFKQLPVEDQHVLRSWGDDAGTLGIALWFLGAQVETDPETVLLLARAALRGDDSGLRGLALRAALQASEETRRTVVNMHRVPRTLQSTGLERYYRTLAAVLDEAPDVDVLPCMAPEFLGQALVAAPPEAAQRWSSTYAQLLLRATEDALSRATVPKIAMQVDASPSDTPWHLISAAASDSESTRMFSRMTSWGGLADGSFADMFPNYDARHREEHDALEVALDTAHASGFWLYGAFIPAPAFELAHSADASFLPALSRLFADAAGRDSLSTIQSLIEPAVEWGLTIGSHVKAIEWFDWLESTDLFVKPKDRRTELLRRHAALARATSTSDAEARWRRLISAQTNDLDLFKVLAAIAEVNSPWMLEEAGREYRSKSPRGRAMAMLMAAVADPTGDELKRISGEVCGSNEGWYRRVADHALLYVERRVAQRQWLVDLLGSDDPTTHMTAAHLVEFLGHPSFAMALETQLIECGGAANYKFRARHLPPFNRRNRRLSEWRKEMADHLFGYRKQDHGVAPWLPDISL